MTAPLDADTIDDILYLARVGDLSELQSLLSAPPVSDSPAAISSLLAAAADAATGNSPAHYAAANGHTGMLPRGPPRPKSSPRHGRLESILTAGRGATPCRNPNLPLPSRAHPPRLTEQRGQHAAALRGSQRAPQHRSSAARRRRSRQFRANTGGKRHRRRSHNRGAAACAARGAERGRMRCGV